MNLPTHLGTTWELPFADPAELELQTEAGSLALVPVEPGQSARLELANGTSAHVEVLVEKVGQTVRVSLNAHPGPFGGWGCRATLYVPPSVRAHIQTNAAKVSVRDLSACELGIKANAGTIDLVNVHGLMHLAADAGSITGREVGGLFDIDTQAGSVRLDITDLQNGEHRIRASLGSIRVELAQGMDVAVEARTTLGSVRNSYPMRLNAAARLLLTTEMGSVRVDEGSWAAQSARSPAHPTSPSPRADAELDRILKMVEAGELSAHDADDLLRAMGRV